MHFTISGEGATDIAVVERIIRHAGGEVAIVHRCSGKTDLLRRLTGFNHAARISPWFVLADLDNDGPCAPPVIARWLPAREPAMCLRVVVRELEAWLLADRERIATYLSVAIGRVPDAPEMLPDPKRALVDLARHSRSRAVQEDIVPEPGSGRFVGRGYTGRIIDYAAFHWRPEAAAERADSLRRCLARLDAIGAAA